ncbi:TonB-dependent receptor [Pedobacter arcticus]|uniref:TonB-dependent receptor n=1 Tax=Pedobacter arcticus TaxID=752140 RepID=UPI00036BC77C|nr:TonB-dependent receptor [Pedobacter arcticus]
MRQKLRKKLALSLMTLLLTTFTVFAQVTTSSLGGLVKDAKGDVLPGATVKAVHTPTGTNYTTITNVDGRFNISNMRVGGPYKILVSFIGLKGYELSNVNLKLGNAEVLSVTLADEGRELQGVTVVGLRDNVLNSKRTGAATNISREQIENLPTLSRSLQDFTRLTPQANGNSFGGANNKFNNITIDGAVNNDVFGLSSSGTPGGPAGTQPISLDAIQEIQVVIAPYDVTSGNFTGAGINAVTRSGTNTTEGSVYFFGRNENTTGKNILTGAKSAPFTNNQYGFRLGGPILKDKLFFFVNAELGRRTAPLSNNAGEAGAAMTLATAQSIANFTQQTYGYDVGNFTSIDAATENDKIFTKLDWNINDKNQLTARYNYIDAFDDNISRSGTFFRFGNNGYKFTNKQHVGVAELRTKISDRMSNNLILGYTRVRDAREIAGGLFPQITILNLEGVSGSSAELGSQRSSTANQLDQDIFEFTDNFKLNLGKHNLTFGTHNEFFSFRNLFINNANGRWDYNSVADYLAGKPSRVRATYSRIAGDPLPAAEFSAAQLAFYAQDDFEVLAGLKLTAGLRVDLPIFGDAPLRNTLVETSFPGYRTDMTPKSKPLFAPRLGFNYDIKGDRSVQLRGGTGIFTGRVPFVWLSNQYGNSGVLFGTVDRKTSTGNPLTFVPDANNQQSAGAGSNKAEVNLITEDFKIPQVFRSNLALDFKLPFGVTGTLEGIYSKTINNVLYTDINLAPNTTSARLNPLLSNNADNRLVYGAKVDGTNFTNAILLDNTSKGYTYNLTAQLQKNFGNGVSASFAYTNTEAKSLNDGTSSTALSNWEFLQVVNDPNNPRLATSSFQTRHRLVGSLNYKISYGKDKAFGTGISVFYAGFSGTPFTYLYNGDLNGDGHFSNDLFYVPRTQSEIKLLPLGSGASQVSAADQWTALNAFIESDPYLKTIRGEYTERNGAGTPWQHQFDARITQDLGAILKGTKNRLQLTFDVFNVGNLINKDWGRSYFVSNQALTLVTYVSNANPANAGFTFRAPSNGKGYQEAAFDSTWSGQFGIRYIFN